mmetsp:Transcript_34656/g.48275  ORF Transcript_34656/g.48275 Transcript_34656/m.48275 type:complete len:81 (-) Transcript_34656:22-264(-)
MASCSSNNKRSTVFSLLLYLKHEFVDQGALAINKGGKIRDSTAKRVFFARQKKKKKFLRRFARRGGHSNMEPSLCKQQMR